MNLQKSSVSELDWRDIYKIRTGFNKEEYLVPIIIIIIIIIFTPPPPPQNSLPLPVYYYYYYFTKWGETGVGLSATLAPHPLPPWPGLAPARQECHCSWPASSMAVWTLCGLKASQGSPRASLTSHWANIVLIRELVLAYCISRLHAEGVVASVSNYYI